MNLLAQVKQAIDKAHDYAIQHQYPGGYWRSTIQSNNTMEAEFIFLNYYLGINNLSQNQKIIKQILRCQRDDGTWGMYYESPGDLSTTIECYFALKLSGLDIKQPALQKAREFILSHGGIEKARDATKFWLALMGQWPYEKTPLLMPEIMLLPTWFPINIYEFAFGPRSIIPPLSIIRTIKPVCYVPESAGIKELFIDKPEDIQPFSMISLFNKLFNLYEKSPWKPGRQSAINRILLWMFEHQQSDGTWCGCQVAWAYIIAFKTLGYGSHPAVNKALEGIIKNYSYQVDDALAIECSTMPVWDTCYMLTALVDSGLSIDSPTILKAIDYLLKNQITSKGDWQIKDPYTEPGGWAFTFANTYYPSVLDTSEVITALSHYLHKASKKDEKIEKAIQKGANWMRSMQSKNGGWGFYAKNNTNRLLARFSSDIDLIDPPNVHVTAAALIALSNIGYSSENPLIKRALNFIFSEQESDGSWFGHWHVNYVYGTSIVLTAFNSLNMDMSHPALQKGIKWILSKQNPDGGWGESCASYYFLKYHGKGPSTASQTAWALLGLMAGGLLQHSAITKGIQYLTDTITKHGIWEEPHYTASGIGRRQEYSDEMMIPPGDLFPMGFMVRCDLYRHYWPLRALGVYFDLSVATSKDEQKLK